jgi:hypothetical protein
VLDLVLEPAVVLEDVQAVAQVGDVDQPVPDDRMAPRRDLLVAARVGVRRESRILEQRGLGRIRDVHDHHATVGHALVAAVGPLPTYA